MLAAPFLLVNVPSRASNAEKLIRSPFRVRSRQAEEPEPQTTDRADTRVGRITGRTRPQAPAPLESELGEMTYSCGCGFVFQAPVLTSVSCPHCGDAQAW